jgi:hypothetical protein
MFFRQSSKALQMASVFALVCAMGCDKAEPKVEGVDAAVVPPSDGAIGPIRRPPRTGPDAVNYHRDVRPLLESNCVECHNEGGIGPSRLDDWATVKVLGRSIVAAVESGRMPPWPARDSCREMADSRALSAEAKELIVGWEADGFLEGNPADYRAPTPRARAELGAPSAVMTYPEPFAPAINSDTYRCFYIGNLAEDTYLRALDIIPGERAAVHHVQLHRVDAVHTATLQATDANAPGGGYPCSASGVGAVPSVNMFSYRPGSVAVVLNPGDAVFMEAGSALVLQTHYNTQFYKAGVVPGADQTRVHLWTTATNQPPSHVIYRTGILSPLSGSSSGNPGLVFNSSIPANAPDVVGETTMAMEGVSRAGVGIIGLGSSAGPYIPGEIVGVTPHAHSWATRMTAQLQRADGSGEECLIDIPDWDYGWQLDYIYKQGVPYTQADRIHVACNFDNTAANQPVINGMLRPVQTITYGENTLNEMCLHYLWLRFSYTDFIASKVRP